MTTLATTLTSTDDNAEPSVPQVDGPRNAYAIVTERILAALTAGTVPWHKPWNATAANLVSKKPYRGINQFLLGMAPYASPYWLTFNQAKKLGGTVRKGEHSTIVVFWKWFRPEGADDDAKEIPWLRYYRVFNALQCDGLDVPPPPDTAIVDNVVGTANAVVAGMKNPPHISVGGSLACYMPTFDRVEMPHPVSFTQPERFASTLFHELTHSTGHEKRLNRPEISRTGIVFADEEYSREELVAEMGAAFLSAHTGIELVTEPASASYIASWIKVLKGDSRLVVSAAAQAQRAVDHILGRTFEAADGDE